MGGLTDPQPGGRKEADAGARHTMAQLQQGAPILLRITGGGKKDELQICTLSVSRDLQYLRWQEQEGTGLTQQVPLSSILEIREMTDSSSDGYQVLVVGLDETQGKRSFELIYAGAEDYVMWRDGLRFLAVAATRAAAEQQVQKNVAEQATSRSMPPTPGGNSSDQASLRAVIKRQEDTIAKLKQENTTLTEAVKRKDATIAELLQDVQARPTAVERCNKTESSSRESDDNLRYRENVRLQQKNEKLRKALKAKQKQVAELLEMLGRVMKDTGAESAYEDEQADELEDEEDDDAPPAIPSTKPVAAAGGARLESPGSRSVPREQPARMEDLWEAAGADEGSENVEAVRMEMLELTSQLERLEQAFQAVSAARGQESAAVPPPPVGQPVAPSGDPPALPQGSFAPPPRVGQNSRAQAGVPLPAPSAALDFSSIGDLGLRPSAQRKSTASLQALAKEMQLFEEKKRIVERLATSLDPGSENEDAEEENCNEADDFPLR